MKQVIFLITFLVALYSCEDLCEVPATKTRISNCTPNPYTPDVQQVFIPCHFVTPYFVEENGILYLVQ